jgi:hypothetical protein
VKTTVAFYLLIFYLLALCKPVLPVMHDAVAHFFWKAHHIATVHHHHGDHHAEEEVAASTHDEKNDKSPATSKISEPVSIHIITQRSYGILPLFIKRAAFGNRVYKESFTLLSKFYPPPRFC